MASTVLEATTTCVHVAGGRDSFPNSVAVSDLPLLIQTVPGALNGLDEADEPKVKQEPAVSIRSSVKPDYIVCLEDGKKMKMQIGRAHVRTPVNNAHIVCRRLLEKNNTTASYNTYYTTT